MTTKTPMPAYKEDLKEYGWEVAGEREKPVREVDEKIDMAAQAFKVMDPASELTIGDLRTQLEAKLGSETTAMKEATKEVRKLQDRWLSLPALDAGSWEDWWGCVRRDFSLFPVQEVLGLVVWSVLPKHLQLGVKTTGLVERIQKKKIAAEDTTAFLMAAIADVLGVPSPRDTAKFSIERAMPLTPGEKVAQLYARVKLPYEVYKNRPSVELDVYDRMEFGQHLRQLLPAEIACRLDVRTLAKGNEADIENHLSNLDSHFRPAPRPTQVMVESLPFSMRKQNVRLFLCAKYCYVCE